MKLDGPFSYFVLAGDKNGAGNHTSHTVPFIRPIHKKRQNQRSVIGQAVVRTPYRVLLLVNIVLVCKSLCDKVPKIAHWINILYGLNNIL